jgi:hypothetical protein
MKYILSTLLVLLSFTSFSQDTSDVCMPYTVAKQIAQDLVVGDSAQEILVYTTKELALTQNKVALKDSIITTYRTKELNLLEQVRNERMAKDAYITMYNTLEGDYTYINKQYKNQKFINRVYKVGFWGGLAAGIIGYIILTK